MTDVMIGGKAVGFDRPCFIVAEIGINHNGDVDIAKQLIDEAVKAGADAVKFQKRTVPIVFSPAELGKPRDVPQWLLEEAIERGVLPEEAVVRLRATNFSDTRNGDQKYALEFTEDEYREIAIYCRKRDVIWSASPWDEGSVDFLEQFDVPYYKVASASLTDDGLLRRMHETGAPVVLSTGGSTMEQVRHAVDVLGMENLVILHCTAAYPKGGIPTAKDNINLRCMDSLREEFPNVPIGFSSNDGGRIPAFTAVARGAVMLEVHLTLEHAMWGSDQASSMEPVWFRELCEWTQQIPILLGDGIKRVSAAEEEVMKKLRRVG